MPRHACPILSDQLLIPVGACSKASKDITAHHQEYIPTEGQSTYCELLSPGMENVAPYSELSFSSLNAERTLSFFPISVSLAPDALAPEVSFSRRASSVSTQAAPFSMAFFM